MDTNIDKEVITTDDLAGGGKKNPAHFNESFLKKGSGIAFNFTPEELSKLKEGKQSILIRDTQCLDIDSTELYVLVDQSLHGTCKLGAGFSISRDEMNTVGNLSSTAKEYVTSIFNSYPETNKFFGYRIVESKIEEPILVDVVRHVTFLADVKPRVEKSFVTLDIFKRNDERVVGAAVLVPDVPDLHKDIYNADEVRSAAYFFMENYFFDDTHGINVMHKDKKINKGVRVLQSLVLDEEKTFQCELSSASEEHLSNARKSVTYPAGTWIMYARILDDELWEAIKSGEFTGWSIEGLAKIQPA